MYKIGHIGLGSTHPMSFIQAERELGHVSCGIFDDLHVTDADYRTAFSERHDIPLFDTIETLGEASDIVFIHDVNWDRHVSRLLPLARAGVGIFIDKPMSGSPAEMERLLALVHEEPAIRLTGGSIQLYSSALNRFKADTAERLGPIRSLFAGGPKDAFYYGIHVIAIACSVYGFKVRNARHMGPSGKQQLYELSWDSGRKALVSLGETGSHFPFHLTVGTDKGAAFYQHQAAGVVKEMLQAVLPYLAGDRDRIESGIPSLQELLMCEKTLLACFESERRQGKTFCLAELQEEHALLGAGFEHSYKAAFFPAKQKGEGT